MKKIAAIIFENDKGEILLYLRDDKAGIPFPACWDLFGGHVEEGETIEEALVREVKEELDYELKDFTFFREYDCAEGDVFPNIKFVFYAQMLTAIENLKLGEGQYMNYFSLSQIQDLKIASIHKKILNDYFNFKKTL